MKVNKSYIKNLINEEIEKELVAETRIFDAVHKFLWGDSLEKIELSPEQKNSNRKQAIAALKKELSDSIGRAGPPSAAQVSNAQKRFIKLLYGTDIKGFIKNLSISYLGLKPPSSPKEIYAAVKKAKKAHSSNEKKMQVLDQIDIILANDMLEAIVDELQKREFSQDLETKDRDEE